MDESRHTDIDHIADAIRDRILHGEFPPGTKLSENGLAVEFDCSRTPVREALKRLENDHFIEIVPHSGTYVRNPTSEEAVEITEIRAYIECLAFRLACERNAPCDTVELLAEQMETILSAPRIDFVLFGRTHYNFHRAIVILSGNSMLNDLYVKMNMGFAPVFYDTMDEAGIRHTIADHRRIVEYLEAHDADRGGAFMYSHLWNKRERLTASLPRGSWRPVS